MNRNSEVDGLAIARLMGMASAINPDAALEFEEQVSARLRSDVVSDEAQERLRSKAESKRARRRARNLAKAGS